MIYHVRAVLFGREGSDAITNTGSHHYFFHPETNRPGTSHSCDIFFPNFQSLIMHAICVEQSEYLVKKCITF
jgi:hypothetical protein